MALATNELRSSNPGRGSEIRMVQRQNQVATLAAVSGAPLLVKGLPLAYNKTSNFWVPYTQPSATVASFTVTNDTGTGTDGGTFQIIIDGLAVTEQWDVPIATIQQPQQRCPSRWLLPDQSPPDQRRRYSQRCQS